MRLLSSKSPCISLILACLLLPVLALANETTLTPPSLSSHTKPMIPQSIAHYRMLDPKAEYIVRVDKNGKAMEAVCIEADHPVLIECGLDTINTARFNPAMEGNFPVMADMHLLIHFTNPSLSQDRTIVQNPLDHIETSTFKSNVEKFKCRLSPVDKLDSPLKLISKGNVFHPVDDAGNALQGDAVIEVYIDHEGVPRLSKVIRSDDPAISAASLKSLSSWRFAKPTSESNPTAVKARIPFHYENKAAKENDKGDE